MLTVIRTIILTIAALEIILLLLSVTILPDTRLVRGISRRKNLQMAFVIIFIICVALAIMERYGF